MSNNTPYTTPFLDNFIHASSRLVMLQNLKNCYKYELELDNPQETKNFRSAAMLDLIRVVLDNLQIYMEYLVYVSEPPFLIEQHQAENARRLVEELATYYEWAIEEVKLKQLRQRLVSRESEINILKDIF